MKTFLFAHNPKNWPWENLSNAIRDIEEKGSRLEKWSVRSSPARRCRTLTTPR